MEEFSLAKLNVKIKNCEKCDLCKTRTHAVPGEGGFRQKILFIGEAPGQNEDVQGRPFVGRAGKLLDQLLEELGLTRNDIFITNIVKCRPPQNRNPSSTEINSCNQYLDHQIKMLQPKLICTLGKFSSEYILEKYKFRKESISTAHGKLFKVNSLIPVNILPLYHPAAALYNPVLKDTLREDMKKIKEFISNDESE